MYNFYLKKKIENIPTKVLLNYKLNNRAALVQPILTLNVQYYIYIYSSF